MKRNIIHMIVAGIAMMTIFTAQLPDTAAYAA